MIGLGISAPQVAARRIPAASPTPDPGSPPPGYAFVTTNGGNTFVTTNGGADRVLARIS